MIQYLKFLQDAKDVNLKTYPEQSETSNTDLS